MCAKTRRHPLVLGGGASQAVRPGGWKDRGRLWRSVLSIPFPPRVLALDPGAQTTVPQPCLGTALA